MELENIQSIKKELQRFKEKLKEAEDRLKIDKYASHGCKQTGALRRAALDLKNVLTENLSK